MSFERSLEKSLDVLALGEAMVEFNQQPDGRYLAGFGGDTSNCAIAAARLGARTGYLTQVGDDLFGEQLGVQVEPDGGDVATLLGAEQIARAANLQIAHGDAKTSA